MAPPAPARVDPSDRPPPRDRQDDAPWRPPANPPSYSPRYRQLAIAITQSTEIAIPPYPGVSAGLGIFVGSVLRPRRSSYDRPWRTALGYQLDVGYDKNVRLLHRHRVMATGHGGNRGRFFYQLGGGIGLGLLPEVLLGGVARLGFGVPQPQTSLNGFVIGGSATLDGYVVGAPTGGSDARPGFGGVGGDDEEARSLRGDPIPVLRFGIFLGWAWV